MVFKVKDAADLAEKMKLMITDYDAMIEMGKRARTIAIEKFDINKIAYQYETFLHQVIDGEVNKNELI